MSTESASTPDDAPEGVPLGSPGPKDAEEPGTGTGSDQAEAVPPAATQPVRTSRDGGDSLATTPLDGSVVGSAEAETPADPVAEPTAEPAEGPIESPGAPVRPVTVSTAIPVSPSGEPMPPSGEPATETTDATTPPAVPTPPATPAADSPAPPAAPAAPAAPVTVSTAVPVPPSGAPVSPSGEPATETTDATTPPAVPTPPATPAAESQAPPATPAAGGQAARAQHRAPHREPGDTAVRRRSLIPSDQTEEEPAEAVTQPVSRGEARAASMSPSPAAPAVPSRQDAERQPPTAGPGRPEELQAAGTGASRSGHGRHVSTERSEDEVLLDGSVTLGRPPSRAGSHWAGVLVSVVALPVSWYFLHLGAARAVEAADPLRFALNASALLALTVGAVALALALWTARRSSLGVTVVGVLSTLIGLVAVALPSVLSSTLTPTLERLTIHSDLGADLATYLWTDAVTGKFLAFGLFMIMVGWVSHSARRAGRREQENALRGRHAA
ncbi:hypothetical protein [Actinomyces howellii]|uniref:Uncharacterized protein n=1 Tax=Actinomyces howellii TaxID=52771 RepID=A0A3S4SNR4_9ACTO|nr:hypothetical protein [Actinomyces howellii]VEG29156.1 Uncharacterised protein [Actinomyces howellii]